jgi:hypothetical protein
MFNFNTLKLNLNITSLNLKACNFLSLQLLASITILQVTDLSDSSKICKVIKLQIHKLQVYNYKLQ